MKNSKFPKRKGNQSKIMPATRALPKISPEHINSLVKKNLIRFPEKVAPSKSELLKEKKANYEKLVKKKLVLIPSTKLFGGPDGSIRIPSKLLKLGFSSPVLYEVYGSKGFPNSFMNLSADYYHYFSELENIRKGKFDAAKLSLVSFSKKINQNTKKKFLSFVNSPDFIKTVLEASNYIYNKKFFYSIFGNKVSSFFVGNNARKKRIDYYKSLNYSRFDIFLIESIIIRNCWVCAVRQKGKKYFSIMDEKIIFEYVNSYLPN